MVDTSSFLCEKCPAKGKKYAKAIAISIFIWYTVRALVKKCQKIKTLAVDPAMKK